MTVPVQEDQAYDFTINGPERLREAVQGRPGLQDAAGSAGRRDGTRRSASPARPRSAAPPSGTDGDLAETGSSSATPMIAGIAIALVVVGGGAVFFLRKKKAGTPAQ